MIDSLIAKIALIGVLGIGAQWAAWRSGLPAIFLMLLVGIVGGPVLGLIDPEQDFNTLLEPIIKLAVAVILFEGGLSLNFRDLRHAGWPVLRLVIIGVPLGWALGTAAAHYGADLSLGVSALFGGIMVVTGPTVIGPMLRTLRVGNRTRDILKWEGIVNDPIGALLAVGIYAWITYSGAQRDVFAIGLDVAAATFIAGLLGAALGYALTWLFPRGLVPEYLKAPMLLCTVIAGFVLADLVMHETGLVTVTIMGVVLANRPTFSTTALRRFKEDLAVLLISGVFVILSATIDWETMQAFRLRFVVFLVLLLFAVRPLTVLVSLAFSSVPWRERLFIAWIAPRGIVAVAITGLFSLRLSEYGVADAEALVPLAFAVVIVTIVAHGFSARWWARRLDIDQGEGRGVLMVGANGFTVGFGKLLNTLDVPVLIADPSKFALRTARREGLEVYQGDVVDEVTHDAIDFGDYTQVIAATDNAAYNALICADLGPEVGFDKIAQIGGGGRATVQAVRGRVMLESGASMDDLLTRAAAGWTFSRTRITDKYTLDDHRDNLEEGSELIAVLRDGKVNHVFSTEKLRGADPGDLVISFVPPEAPEERAADHQAEKSAKIERKAKADERAATREEESQAAERAVAQERALDPTDQPAIPAPDPPGR